MKDKPEQAYAYLDDILVNVWGRNINWSIIVYSVGGLSVNRKALVRNKFKSLCKINPSTGIAS
jgi:hypothetical protein